MQRLNALATAALSALLVYVFPALTLAQGQTAAPDRTSPAPAGPANQAPGAGGGSAAWLWVIVALIAIAIIWGLASRRRRREEPVR